MRYYKPSKEQKDALNIVTVEIEKIAKERLNIKSPAVIYKYNDGLQYERLSKGKDLAVEIKDKSNNRFVSNIRFGIAYGHVNSYTIGKQNPIYVLTLKDIVKNGKIEIPEGKWIQYEQKIDKENIDEEQEYYLDEFMKTINSSTPDTSLDNEEDDFDPVEDCLGRLEYCRQYEHDFGTKSTEVSDMF